MPSAYQGIGISKESWSEYQKLIKDPFSAPYVFQALRSIQHDRHSYGRPFRPKSFHGGPLRTVVIALTRDRELWLYWNPDMTPTTVVTLAVVSPR